MPYQKYLEIVKHARAKDVMTVQSNDEIIAWEAPDGSGTGLVSHLSRWTRKNKQTGEEQSYTDLTVAKVETRNGKRVLVELTEIVN